ncbi:MAG TPA: ABC transporter permease [bacterium]|nr:ABC transporter permease [bacterium]
MSRYLVGRAYQALAAIFLALTAAFFLVRINGDPVLPFVPLGNQFGNAGFARHQLGLDRPLWKQYALFLGGAVRADFGSSFRYRAPALPLVLAHVPATAELAAASLLLVAGLWMPLGILSAARRGSPIDTAATVLTVLGEATPAFWLGLMLIEIFAVWLHWVPASGYGHGAELILPMLTLTAFYGAQMARITRSSVLEALGQDYVRAARAKGVGEAVLLRHHVLRNAAIPIVTVFGLSAGQLLGGAVVTETIFSWPGVGQFIVLALRGRDLPVVIVGVFLMATTYVVVNFLVDAAYAWLNPQVRYG